MQRLAKSADMHVDGALIDKDVAAPDPVQQLLAREDATWARHKKLQQLELGRSEVQVHARPPDTMLRAI
jgi:hypothetical protein